MANSVVETRDWSRELLDKYREGCSDAEVAAHLNITVKEFYKQINENSALSALVDMGRTLSLAFWEGQARKNIGNKLFNTPLWSFYMKNKFGWAEKSENTNTDNVPQLTLDQLKTEISKEAEKFIKRNTPELTDAQRVLKGLRLNEPASLDS